MITTRGSNNRVILATYEEIKTSKSTQSIIAEHVLEDSQLTVSIFSANDKKSGIFKIWFEQIEVIINT